MEDKPDPASLVRRWKAFQQRWFLGVFARFPAGYEGVLGADGKLPDAIRLSSRCSKGPALRQPGATPHPR